MILDHLKNLTHNFNGVYAVATYAKPDKSGTYRAFEAEGEGWACLDDTARAALLAFELYEDTDDEDALLQAKNWMTFVEYMLDKNGRFANFIDRNSVINETGITSYRAGEWWQMRGLWALARAYRITRDEHWLDLYWKALRMSHPREGRTMALFNLAKIEIGRTGIGQLVVPTVYGQYYRMGDTFGYHQLLEGVLAHKYQKTPLANVKKAIMEFVTPMVEDGFWSEWKYKSKKSLCAYNVSPTVQGLAEYNAITGQYTDLLEKAYNWFYGVNDVSRVMYDPETGRCFDGLESDHCGAESSICAGEAELAVRRAIDV